MNLRPLALLPTLLLPACAFGWYVQVPEIHGRLIDPAGRPLPNALITITRDHDQKIIESPTADPNGSFHAPQRGHFYILPAIADPLLTSYTLTATAGPLRSTPIQLQDAINPWFLAPTPPKNLGNIPLH